MFLIFQKQNNYEVCFIDIYHLMFPTSDKYKGEKKEHGKEKYNEVREYRCCLSRILQ